MAAIQAYEYYVSYAHSQGYGCAIVTRDGPITDTDNIRELRRYLEEGGRTTGVCVLNFQLLGCYDVDEGFFGYEDGPESVHSTEGNVTYIHKKDD